MWLVAGRITLLVLVLMGMSLARADYEAGQRAWDTGQPAEALNLWQASAEAGDRRAMLALGRLYAQGLGAPQDYIQAHKWFNLAASRGETEAVQERDALAAKMTPQQVAAAQEQAAAWRPGESRKPETMDTAATPAEPPPKRAIHEAQKLLGVLGYQPGPADGIWGKRSTQAYRTFLRDTGQPVSDTLTPEALRAMRQHVRRHAAGASGREASLGVETRGQEPGPTKSPAARARPDALHRAAQQGDGNSLKAALDAGADVNGRDGRGWTPLMHAANKGYPLLVEPLLAARADPDIRASDGATALFMAALHGHTEIIELLMRAGADITIRGPKGKTAVDAAHAKYGDLEMARKVGVDSSVLALLQGITLNEMHQRLAEERRIREQVREVISEALATAQRLKYLYQRVKAFSSIAAAQTKAGNFQDALATTQRIENDLHRSEGNRRHRSRAGQGR